ncbi:hypothetical protein [Ferrimonas marina]|uniref:Uncharacterized protein n=1 Tax=Ferrimonas marina TaxID=299255 RepID=A0A1M5SBQ4_9GAMM|nr:hypothetical protein [Ferrimonas marina]SHH35891.1 hypothetical protein SAMN02745129_1943 [Ferrimonas marina]
MLSLTLSLSVMLLLMTLWMLPGYLVLRDPRRCGWRQVGWALAAFSFSYPAWWVYRMQRRCHCLEIRL